MKSISIFFILILSIFFSCQAQQAKVGDISVEQFLKEFDSKSDIVLDVRTMEEWQTGIFPCALKLNFYDDNFDVKISELDRTKNYYVYCKSGGRSAKTLNKMKELGFVRIQNILGGATEMKAKEVELIKP